mmetsp:Transcript_85157/g.186974  ORF Transcript_85157/g.186974 Transcript_85157/m.186974 type:complete len:213 (-) Transcript_85157:491-1129(-)
MHGDFHLCRLHHRVLLPVLVLCRGRGRGEPKPEIQLPKTLHVDAKGDAAAGPRGARRLLLRHLHDQRSNARASGDQGAEVVGPTQDGATNVFLRDDPSGALEEASRALRHGVFGPRAARRGLDLHVLHRKSNSAHEVFVDPSNYVVGLRGHDDGGLRRYLPRKSGWQDPRCGGGVSRNRSLRSTLWYCQFWIYGGPRGRTPRGQRRDRGHDR